MVFPIGRPSGIAPWPSVGPIDRVATGEGRVFRGSVAVDDFAIGQSLDRAANMRRREHVASGEQLAQAAQIVQALIDHQMKQSRGEPERRHRVLAEREAQFFQRRRPRRHHHQTSAIQQRSPDFKGGCVEAHRRHLQKHFVFTHLGKPAGLHQPDHSSMRNGDALRHSGRAGGVAEVGQMIDASATAEILVRLRSISARSSSRKTSVPL